MRESTSYRSRWGHCLSILLHLIAWLLSRRTGSVVGPSSPFPSPSPSVTTGDYPLSPSVPIVPNATNATGSVAQRSSFVDNAVPFSKKNESSAQKEGHGNAARLVVRRIRSFPTDHHQLAHHHINNDKTEEQQATIVATHASSSSPSSSSPPPPSAVAVDQIKHEMHLVRNSTDSPTIQVFYTSLYGKTKTIVVQEDEAVGVLKEMIFDREGIRPGIQSLWCGKKKLDHDSRPISQYGVVKESMIRLRLANIGGGPLRDVTNSLNSRTSGPCHNGNKEGASLGRSSALPQPFGRHLPYNAPSVGLPIPPAHPFQTGNMAPMHQLNAVSAAITQHQAMIMGMSQQQAMATIAQQQMMMGMAATAISQQHVVRNQPASTLTNGGYQPRLNSILPQTNTQNAILSAPSRKQNRPPAKASSTAKHGDKRKMNGRKAGAPRDSKDLGRAKSLMWQYATTVDPRTGQKWKSQRKFLEAHNVIGLQSTFSSKIRKWDIESYRKIYQPNLGEASEMIEEKIRSALDKAFPNDKTILSISSVEVLEPASPSTDNIDSSATVPAASAASSPAATAAEERSNASTDNTDSSATVPAASAVSSPAAPAAEERSNASTDNTDSSATVPAASAVSSPAATAAEERSNASPHLRLSASTNATENTNSTESPSPLPPASSYFCFESLKEDLVVEDILLRANPLFDEDGNCTAKSVLKTLEAGQEMDGDVVEAALRLVANEFDETYALSQYFFSHLTNANYGWGHCEQNYIDNALVNIHAKAIIIPIFTVDPRHWTVVVRTREEDNSFTFHYRDSLNCPMRARYVEQTLRSTSDLFYDKERGDRFIFHRSVQQVELECGAEAIMNAYGILLDNEQRGEQFCVQRPDRAILARSWVKKSLLDGRIASLAWLHDVKVVHSRNRSKLGRKKTTGERIDRDEKVSLKCNDGRRNNGRKAGTKFVFPNLDEAAKFIEQWYQQDSSLLKFCNANPAMKAKTKVDYPSINRMVTNIILPDGLTLRNHRKMRIDGGADIYSIEDVREAIEKHVSNRSSNHKERMAALHRQNRILLEDDEALIVKLISDLSLLGYGPTVKGVKRFIQNFIQDMDYGPDYDPKMIDERTVRRLIERAEELRISTKASQLDIKRARKATEMTQHIWFLKLDAQFKVLRSDPSNNLPEEWKTWDDVPPEYKFNFDELAADTAARYDRKVANAEHIRLGKRLFSVTTNGDDQRQPFHVSIGMFTAASGRFVREKQRSEANYKGELILDGAPPPVVIHSRPQGKGNVFEPNFSDRAHIEQCRAKGEYYNRHGFKLLTTKNGSMEQSRFHDLIDHFLSHLPPHFGPGRNQKPCFLFVDGHASRWDWDEIARLKLAGVHLLILPSHTSVWSQPNDNGPNKRLHSHIVEATDEWMLANNRDHFSRKDFNAIFVDAWGRFIKEELDELLRLKENCSTRAFDKTGIHPFNSECTGWKDAVDTLGGRGLRTATSDSFLSGEEDDEKTTWWEIVPRDDWDGRITEEDGELIYGGLDKNFYEANKDKNTLTYYTAAFHMCKCMINRHKASLNTNHATPEPWPSNAAEKIVAEKYFQFVNKRSQISASEPKKSQTERDHEKKMQHRRDVVELTDANGILMITGPDGEAGIAHKLESGEWQPSDAPHGALKGPGKWKLSVGEYTSSFMTNEELINDLNYSLEAKKAELNQRQRRSRDKRKLKEAQKSRQKESDKAKLIATNQRHEHILAVVRALMEQSRDTERFPSEMTIEDIVRHLDSDGSVGKLLSAVETPYTTSVDGHEVAVNGNGGCCVASLAARVYSMSMVGASKSRGNVYRKSKGGKKAVSNTPNTEYGAGLYDLLDHDFNRIASLNLHQKESVDKDSKERAEEIWNILEKVRAIDEDHEDWFDIITADPKLLKSDLEALAQFFGVTVVRADGKKTAPTVPDYVRELRELVIDEGMFLARQDELASAWMDLVGTDDAKIKRLLGRKDNESRNPNEEKDQDSAAIDSDDDELPPAAFGRGKSSKKSSRHNFVLSDDETDDDDEVGSDDEKSDTDSEVEFEDDEREEGHSDDDESARRPQLNNKRERAAKNADRRYA